MFEQLLVALSVSVAFAEPPVSSYLPPSIGGGISLGSGSGFTAVNSGYQESEGANIDAQLLHKIEEILLDQENQASSTRDSPFGLSAPSSIYGVPPSQSYGPPSHHSDRVLGVHLGSVQQGIQVAQFHQSAAAPSHSYNVPSGSYGPPLFSVPSSSYGAPSIGAPSAHAPSTSYGLPISAPSSSYGSPALPPVGSPSSTYGAHSFSHAGHVGSHGSHSHSHGHSSFGPPPSRLRPATSYEAPTSIPSSSYGVPSQSPSSYLPPRPSAHRPSSSYGAPTQTIVLVQQPRAHSSPLSSYLPPSNSYLP